MIRRAELKVPFNLRGVTIMLYETEIVKFKNGEFVTIN